MSNLEFLITSANGIEVFYDPIHSHTATHFEDAPQLKAFVQEILAKTALTADRMQFDTDLGRIIGNTDLVDNDEGDIIVFAKRKNRDNYTSFNKSKTSQPCSTITVDVEKIAEDRYELLSAWVGFANSPPFPGDKNETLDSKDFWLRHALAWGSQEIQPDTETSTCPW